MNAMSYVVLARKYRPRSFAEMVGQPHVVRALGNALERGRLHHAYLFTGTRGIGKTTISRILAKSLNCTGADGQGGITAAPCGVCPACTAIDADRYVDYIELDAASNRSIDEIRDLIERAAYKPSVGPAQYRRTLYAYWRRSSAPTFLFDSAQRRVCEVRANRTNTPLHALTLLNDTGMLEASRVLAERVASEDPDQAISLLGEAILNRSPSTAERAVLLREHHQSLDYYDSNPADAVAFTLVGQQAALTEASAPAVAAWMTVASLILNLDEAMTME